MFIDMFGISYVCLPTSLLAGWIAHERVNNGAILMVLDKCMTTPGRSPGDPPGNRVHQFKPKRITPFIHRLVSDPIGKEAGWETNIGDTNHVNKHIN
jgi:hypothetical protein